MKPLFALAVLVNASLIFWVELLFAKRLLPTLGGAPALWNTCLMFYQVLLLVGYAYAHFITRMDLRRQVVFHGGVTMVAVAGLPWFLFLWRDPGATPPVLWLLVLLTLSLGLPFFVLAGAAPLVQRWFSLSGHRDAGDPYFLFAASNFGSFLGLAAYPVILEPLWTLDQQTAYWKVSFTAVALLLLGCGFWSVRARRHREDERVRPQADGSGVMRGADPHVPLPDVTLPDEPITAVRRWRWVGLAFLPSSLLLGVTTHITSEIAPVPLLWVIPLALYLLTFVIAFGPGRRGRPRGPSVSWSGALRRPLVTATVAVAMGVSWFVWTRLHWLGRIPDPGWFLVLADLTVLFVGGLLCHTRLARDRPLPRHLAEFYLWIALGGALGGVFNTLIAPILFKDPLEYPLALAVLAYLVASQARPGRRRLRASDLLLGAVPGVAALLLLGAGPEWRVDAWLILVITGALCLALAGRPARFGLGIAGLVLVGFQQPPSGGEVVFKDRTFYGIHRIYREAGAFWLAHGSTIHGGQDPARPDVPLTYYHPAGPAGSLLSATDAHVAVVGLGSGSLISYAEPGQRWTFYELDPSVVRLAEDGRYFTYLRDSTADYRHVIGDARLSLERTHDSYDLIVIDAFSSDAVPVHLLTVEAVELYRERLRPGGRIGFHVSNRYADFSDVLANVAADIGLVAYEARDGPGEADRGHFASHWVMLGESGTLRPDERWSALESSGARRWTDSYSSLFQALRW